MRMRGAVIVVAVLLAPGLAGCLDFLGQFTRPDYAVSRTELATGPDNWNRNPSFVVEVQEPTLVEVRIVATPHDGSAPLTTRGVSMQGMDVRLDIPDGTWTVEYYLDGHKWETFRAAQFDSTLPTIDALESIGQAPEGRYTLGATAIVESGARVEVVLQATDELVATALPVLLEGLADGVHVFVIRATDPAGNADSWTVQVVAGSATRLPAGQFTAGIVARYTTSLRLWDLTNLGAYLSPEAAQAAAPTYLGAGRAITPDDPTVQQVVADLVRPGMTTMEIALALFTWMHDELDYDEARLEADDLLDPAATIANKGGVCRDLAALYVSLLREAGVPARLVAGYLAGRVNGFHAWVEVYGGSVGGQDPWIPVDVSGIDGPYTVPSMLQSFGVRLPEHLGLRALTPEQEQGDWSNAATLAYSHLQGTPAPVVDFDKDLSDVTQPVRRSLCIHVETRLRAIASPSGQCASATHVIHSFVVQAQRVLDYGIEVTSMASGSTVTTSLVFPDGSDDVDFLAYVNRDDGLRSAGFREEAGTGRMAVELRR